MQQNHVLIKKLSAVGLTSNEAKVYLAALEAGSAPVSVIAQKAGLNRVSTHSILQRMLTKGIFAVVERSKIRHFTPIDPELFVNETKQKTQDLAESLPLFHFLSGRNASGANVRFFEGIEGVKAAYMESLQSTTEIYNYADSRNIRKHWPEYDQEYVIKRAERRIFLKGLVPDDAVGRKVQSEDRKYYREMRLLPAEDFRVENEVKIFDHTTLIVSFKPKVFAVIIDSSAVADTQRQIFQILWEFAGKHQ